MENKTLNGQLITDTTMTTESNSLVMRKGRSTLLASKVLLIALLNIENRDNKKYTLQERAYYKQLERDTNVDYSKGIVSEINTSDLKKLLNKKNSGSFYKALRELFSLDPHEPRSLRNAFACMLPNEESGVLGYAEVVTSCHMVGTRLFIKYSGERFVRSQLMQLKSEYTELPLLVVAGFKSVYTLRLFEILSSAIQGMDAALQATGQDEAEEYSFRYSLGELQLMFGIVDITADSEGKKSVAAQNPDYNSIVREVNERLHENMGSFAYFKRYALTTAVDEINKTDAINFRVSYSVERETEKRITHIIFFVKKKGVDVVDQELLEEHENHGDIILSIAKELSALTLNYNQLLKIADAAEYDKETILAAYNLYCQMNLSCDFVNWFVELRK